MRHAQGPPMFNMYESPPVRKLGIGVVVDLPEEEEGH